jgi:glycosyltransferase involved in cell wall biosynthesis
MRILITTGIYPPDGGGPATYSKLLYEELPKHNIQTEILSFGSVRHLPKLIRHFFYFCKVLKKGRKTDIIFSQDPVSVGLPSLIAAKILRKKFVLKIVGDYAWEQGMQRFGVKDLLDDFFKKKYGWPVEFLRKIQKFVAQNAKIIIVPSEYLKKIIIKWGIDSEKIKVIYNAFEKPELKISKEETRNKFNLSGTIIISAGRLVPWKGFSALIEIMPEILERIPEAKLIIIGDGPEFKNIKYQISNLKINKNIFLTGQISHDDVLLYFRAGDIFVLNTAYEGFSHFLLEAMAMGLPVITTKVGGNQEIIENGKNGSLVDYNNKDELKRAVIDLYNNWDLRTRMAQNAKNKVMEFTKEKMINETIRQLNYL